MVLEATVIILDNSDWMRNGDYTPTRYAAQKDAVNLIYSAKLQDNPENTVALLAMAGKSPEVLVTLTDEIGHILSGMHKMTLGGSANFESTLQIAQLALKHRANKNQRQRIVAFVGSPIETDEKTLVRLAKKLKKNNIAVDFVNFGEITENESKLEAFISNINSNDNSHLVTIPPGPHILSDLIRTSPILGGDGSGAGGSGGDYGGGDGGDFEFGVDPSLDPELAMALRMSMEEEQARQAAAKARAQGEGGSGGEGASLTADAKQPVAKSSGSSAQPSAQSAGGQQPTDDEDALLARALAMSTDGDVQMGNTDEDDELARAIALSMQQQQQPPSGASGSQRNDDGDDVMSSVISSLPGVDPNDPQLKDMLDDKSKKDTKRDQQ